MEHEHKPDTLYLGMVGLLGGASIALFLISSLIDEEWLSYRPAALAMSLVAAIGLFMRGRANGRLVSLCCGLLLVTGCGLQLAWVIVGGSMPANPASAFSITQSFASGMFCVGGALVLDSMFPPHWGRHLLFGLLGAVAAMIGTAGLFAVVAGWSLALNDSLLDGMRLPGSSILLLSGLSLLIGARLRSTTALESFDTSLIGEELQDRSGLVAALAVMLVTLGAALLVWRQVEEQNRKQFQIAQNESLHRLVGTLSSNVANAAMLLDGIRGLFAASEHVDLDEWLSYFARVPFAQRHPGAVVVAYAARLRNPEVDESGQRSIAVNGAGVRIWPSSNRELIVPTLYVVPPNQAEFPIEGLDLASDPVLSEVLARAESSPAAAISARIDFTRFGDPESRTGFIVAMRLPQGPDDHLRPALDTMGVTGFVYCALDIEALVTASLRESRSGGLSLRVIDDASSSRGELLFQSIAFDATLPTASMIWESGGRSWTISAQSDPAMAAATGSRNPYAVLIAGLFVALVLFAVTWVLTGHRARALHFARRSIRELGRAQKAQQAVTDTARAGIITADVAGNILYMNPAAAREFNVDAQAMKGLSLVHLMPERFREAHRAGLARVAAGGEGRVLGKAFEMAGLRADGSEFPLEILLSAWTSEQQTYFTAFVTDITDRQTAQLELSRRAQELERSNADLEQFAYVASHDLQEPLRMVASYVQLLARRYRGQLDADADEFIEFAVDGATRMQDLIEDLLAFARVGRSGLEPVPTDLRACADAAIARLQESISESGAEIRIDLDGSVLAVPAQLTQVFQNLVANALKFRGPGVPEVTINAVREDPDWHVRVADNGIGIAPKHCERVFAIFQRLHTRNEYSGTGIGLAICRRIIDSFGGRIWVESTPGAGSVFHFVLPQSGSKA